MALTKTQVSELYVAIYNRASEGEGNTYWQSREGSQADIANAMLATDPAQTYFGSAVDDPQAFIQHIYLNTLGRTLEDDPEGIAFWAARLEGGQSKGEVVVAIIESLKTQTEDSSAEHAENYQYFLNRVAVSNYAADQTPEPFPAGFDYDKMLGFNTSLKVTNDPATLEEAKKIVDSIANPGNVFTLTENMSEGTQGTADITEVYWGYNPDHKEQGGIPLSELVEFVTTITGLDLAELGLIDDDGVGPFDNVQNLQLSIGDISANRGSEVTIIFNDGTSISAEAQLGDKYFDFLSSLLFDEDGNSRLFEKVVVAGEEGTGPVRQPIVLTPSQNNGGTEEYGFTTAGDDLIVAGRLELLHGAYIDGGSGINTLEIDAKGIFAQPKELLNIQHIKVHNLPNIYTNDDGENGYPDVNDEGHDAINTSSIIDLSRAGDLETLTINEGDFDGLRSVDTGTLTIAGIRNGALTRLEGGFTQNVTLHYGEGLTGAINLELAIGTVTADIKLLHNASTLNIASQGVENHMHNFFAGDQLTHLNISGEAIFSVRENLAGSFAANRPAVIDASANTGGVALTINGHADDVVFTGSQAGDRISADNNGKSVTINAGNGDNEISANDGELVSITSGDGNDVISAVRGDSVTIDAGNGDNQITVSAEQMDITTGAGNDTIVISGMVGTAGLDADGNFAALVNIDTGAGQDTLVLGRDLGNADFGLVALEGSSISGESITLYVENSSDLRAAELAGIDRVVINHDMGDRDGVGEAELQPSLTLTASQFVEIGAENFHVEGSIFNTYGQLKIIVDQNMDLSALAISSLPNNLDLQLEINNGVTLTLTAQQLHEWVAPNGVTLANQGTDVLTGKVEIVGAGANFDPFNTNDQVKTNIEGKKYFGGSLSDDFLFGGKYYNVKLDASPSGYDRPADVPVLTRFTLDTDVESEYGAFSTWHTYLRIIGEEDFVFNVSEEGLDDWGQYNPGGSAIEIGKSLTGNQEFVVDFSNLEGELINLAIARFEDAKQVWGNGTDANPARLNVELTGDVGAADAGLFSRDVQTYVVTDLNGDDRVFWTSQPTQDLETLGLRGNYDDSITFGNTERGVDFLLEVAYNKFDGYAVGTVNANFARPIGAEAVVNVVGLQALPAGEVQKVAGITTNATTAVVNVEGGNTLIEQLAGNDLTSLTLSADANLTVQDLDGIANGVQIDASGVTGALSLSANFDADFGFVGAAGGSTLIFSGDFEADNGILDGTTTSIDGGTAGVQLVVAAEVAVDLKAATLTNATSVVLGQESTLALTLDQADAIGAGNFALALGATAATLNLSGLAEQEFALANYADGIEVDLVELANQPEITLHPNTDLSGITELKVHPGTVLNLTAAQFQQLEGNGAISGVDGSNFTVNITDLTQADVDAGFDLSGIIADNVTVTLAENVQLADTDSFGTLANTTIVIGGFTLTLAELVQADGLAVTGAAGSVLQFNAVNLDSIAPATGIDASLFDVETLRLLNVLVANQNIDAIFLGLPEGVEKVVYTGEGWADGVNQTVTIEQGTTVPGFLTLDKVEEGVEIQNFTLNLQGGTEITGHLNLTGTGENGLIHTHLKTVVINSTGTAENLLTGKVANIITGNINPLAGTDAAGNNNNLLNLTINAEQALEIKGDIIFSSVVGDDHVTANDDDSATAVLTIEGSADVTLGGLNTQDDDVDALIVTNNGTGTVKATLDAADIDQDVAGDNNDALSFLGSNIELTTVGAIDLSDDTITGVSKITLTDASATVLTLTQEQFNDLGAANLVTANTVAPFPTLHLVEFDGAVEFDATAVHAGIDLVSITIKAGAGAIDPATNLTGVDSIIVPEGETLTLTAAQFQQLQGAGVITGVGGTTDYNVVITDLTQAIVNQGFNITGVTSDSIKLTLAENVNLIGSETVGLSAAELAHLYLGDETLVVEAQTLLAAGQLTATNLGNLANLIIELAAGQQLGLGGVEQANGLNVNGLAATVVYQFTGFPGFPTQIDASDYNIAVLKALAASFTAGASQNVEYIIDDLPNSVELRLYEDELELGHLNSTHRVVVIEAGVSTPTGLAFNDWDATDEVRTLKITLEGDATLSGDLSIPTRTDKDDNYNQRYFDTLTIVSEGAEANTIAGNIDTVPGAPVLPNTNQNNLLNVVIEANQDLVVTGTITFNSIDVPNDDAVATLTVSGAGDVSIKALDTTDVDIATLNIANTGTGTLTVTGGSDALELDGTESLIFTGTGNIVLDTHTGAGNNGIEGNELSVIDASGLSGNLDLGVIEDIDSQDFAFTSGSGVTKLTLAVDELDADVAADPVETGWSFDFSNAAAGSEFHIGDGPGGNAAPVFTKGPLNIDLGANTTLYINEDTDWTGVDLSITQGLPIVLADGVTLTLTAEQASGLTIIEGADTGAAGFTGQVVIGDLGNYTDLNGNGNNDDAAELFDYDFSGLSVRTIATLFDNDVTLSAGTVLGSVIIQLADVADGVSPNNDLAGQTIRFATVEQAERVIEVLAINGAKSTNVVWLFDSLAAPVDTAGYAADIARLWLTEQLINSYGGDVEQLFTTLPNSILRVDFTSLTALDVLLTSAAVHRVVELVHFTELNDITFSDVGIDPVEHVESLTLKLGGEVQIGNILLDDSLPSGHDPASVVFTTLTIDSQRALHEDHLLASEHFKNNNDGIVEDGEHQQPDAVNTIGDISVGAGLDLLNVIINTHGVGGVDSGLVESNAGAVLNIGTLTFGARTAHAGNTPVLNVSGSNDVNIASVVATDAELAGPVTVINNLVGAALTAPGASPAIVLGAQIEALLFQGTEATAVTNLGSADPANPNAGVSGSELSVIDASAYAGALHLGILALIDGTNDVDSTTPAFTLTTGTGITTATLDKDPDSADVPTLAAGSEWIFDYTNAAADSRLTITDAVVFEAPVAPLVDQARLTLKNVDLYIDGDVDLTDVVLTADVASHIHVPADSSLTLTSAQVALLAGVGVPVTGSGTVVISDEVDTDSAVALDLSGIQTLGIDLSGITNVGADPQANPIVTTLAPAGAVDDAGDPAGFNVIGSAFNDGIIGSDLDDVLDGGAGDDVLIGALGNDTFLVSAGNDTIVDLTADGTEDDVLVVSAGATANAAGIVEFTATADTVNNGTANLSTDDVAGGTIDVSLAGGANGFNLTGGDGLDTLIGSDQSDVIIGGKGADKLTGGLGADTFFFGIEKNSPAAPTINLVTQGVDRELITITNPVGAAEVVTDNEYLMVSYSVNGVGVVPPILIDLRPSAGVDVRDVASVATAVAAHLNGLAGITATAAAGEVTVAGENGNAVTINSVSPAGFDAGASFAAASSNGADAAHVVTLAVPAGTDGGNYVVGDFIKLTVTLAGGTELGVEYTVNSTDGLTPNAVTTGLTTAFNDALPAGSVNAAASGTTITLTDEEPDNGAFSVAVNVAGGVTSVDSSALGAADPATLDVITDFLSGTDKLSFAGLVAGSATNYVEAAAVADYATALADANSAFNGTVIYYLSSYNDGTDDVGVLFFDANGDGAVDGAVQLAGIDQDSFAFSDILAG